MLGKQALGVVAVAGYSFVVTLILGYAIKYTIGFRIKESDEVEGIDISEHSEHGYEFGQIGAGGSFATRLAATAKGGE